MSHLIYNRKKIKTNYTNTKFRTTMPQNYKRYNIFQINYITKKLIGQCLVWLKKSTSKEMLNH
ncbi:MAG TPA: hypothetical protein DCZ80_01590 [Legionellales bacterium]|nr:hypothetical protein [Legionellales bacterium]